jgi:hypothetical protein
MPLPYRMYQHTEYHMTSHQIIWDGYVVVGPDGRTAFRNRSLFKCRAFMDRANSDELASRRRDEERERELVLSAPDRFDTK